MKINIVTAVKASYIKSMETVKKTDYPISYRKAVINCFSLTFYVLLKYS